MKTTRTQFLATVASGLAAAALRPSTLLGSSPYDVQGARLFKTLVGEVFRFQNAWRNEAVNLILSGYAEQPPRKGTSQFTLTFVAPLGENLKEGTYTVDQPIVGTFPVFIIPMGLDAKGQALYRADFNLLVAVTGSPSPVQRR